MYVVLQKEMCVHIENHVDTGSYNNTCIVSVTHYFGHLSDQLTPCAHVP
jgi:hypothetical protein